MGGGGRGHGLMAISETAKLIVDLSIKGGGAFRSAMTGAQRSLRSLDAHTQRTQAALGKTARNLKLLGAGVITGGAVALKWAADFEAQLNTINTVADVTPERLEAIGDDILKLARTTGTSIDDLTGAYYDLVSAGIDASDAQNVLTNANKLAIGGLSTTNEAVDLLTTALNAYGLKGKDASRITDYFAQAIAAGKVSAAELAGTFARIGPIAASAGIGIDELAASYGQMTAAGVPAAEASTQMRAAIVALQKPSKNLQKLQDKLGKDFARMARQKGLAYTYNYISKQADRYGYTLQDLLGRQEAVQYALFTSGDAYKDYRRQLRDVRKAHEGLGVAQGQMDKRQKGVTSSLRRLREIAKSTGITLLQGLLPGVERVATKIGKLVEDHQPAIKQFGKDFGKLVDELFTDENVESAVTGALDFLRDLPWDTIKDGMKITADATKTAVDAFKSLPPGVQSTLIGLLAANKLTGGLATAALKDLTGLALQSLKSITAGAVTVTGATVTVAGGGTPGIVPTGGAGGKGTPAGLPIGGILGGVAVGATGAVIGITLLGNLVDETKRGKIAAEATAQQMRLRGASDKRIEEYLRTAGLTQDEIKQVMDKVSTKVGQVVTNTDSGPSGPGKQPPAPVGERAPDFPGRPVATPGRRSVSDWVTKSDLESTYQSLDRGVRAAAGAIAIAKNAAAQAAAASAARDATMAATLARARSGITGAVSGVQSAISARLAGATAMLRAAQAGAAGSVAGAIRSDGSSTRATIRAARPIVNVTNNISATATAGAMSRVYATNRVIAS